MANRNRQCIRFCLLLGFGLFVSSPLLADGLPTYAATTGAGSFAFQGHLGMSSFSVTGPEIVASGSVGPFFEFAIPPDELSGFPQIVEVDFSFVFPNSVGYVGSAVAGGTAYDLLFSGDVAVVSNGPVIWPTGTTTLTLPGSFGGRLLACTPSSDCSLGGGMQVFNLDWNLPGRLILSFADDGCGCGSDVVTSATFTQTPEPSSIVLVLLGALTSTNEVLYRCRQRRLSRLE